MSNVPALWTKNRGIALGIATEWNIPGMDPDDVRQEALVALWEAARCHDPSKGRFPPFARLVIKRRMRDHLQAATRQKRVAQFAEFSEPVGQPLEDLVLQREQLQLALFDPVIVRRREWREAKRKQRAA
jgi:DNA-directed RNA polymerase specialized sigma24 family protein